MITEEKVVDVLAHSFQEDSVEVIMEEQLAGQSCLSSWYHRTGASVAKCFLREVVFGACEHTRCHFSLGPFFSFLFSLFCFLYFSFSLFSFSLFSFLSVVQGIETQFLWI